jgi:hypothetical protein
VGIGTFRPVMAEDPRQHRMDPEWFDVPESTPWPGGGARSGAGASSPSAPRSSGRWSRRSRRTNRGSIGWKVARGGRISSSTIPFAFRAVDGLITNFHLPRSTLLMLVSAFAGLETTRRAYRAAMREGYRFYSTAIRPSTSDPDSGPARSFFRWTPTSAIPRASCSSRTATSRPPTGRGGSRPSPKRPPACGKRWRGSPMPSSTRRTGQTAGRCARWCTTCRTAISTPTSG